MGWGRAHLWVNWSRYEVGAGICNLGQILTPGPSLVGPTWVAQGCASGFTDTTPINPIGTAAALLAVLPYSSMGLGFSCWKT